MPPAEVSTPGLAARSGASARRHASRRAASPLAPAVLSARMPGAWWRSNCAPRRGEGVRTFGRDGRRGAARLGFERDRRRIAQDALAVLAPEAAQRPARQLLAGIPFALAEMQQRSLGEAVGELAEQHAGQPPLL